MDEKELKGRQAQKVFCFFQIIVIYTAVHMSKAVSETFRPWPHVPESGSQTTSPHLTCSGSVQTTRTNKVNQAN